MTLWQKLVTKEKALFKSSTMWLAGLVTALPTLLPEIQANFPTVAAYIPPALHDPVMRLLGLAIFVCRLRSMVKMPPTMS